MPDWKNRIVGYGEVAPDQLLANPKNWRIHPEAQQKALGGVLEEVGWVQAVMVNRLTGFVVDGHARVGLAIAHEQPSVPVVYVELSEGEEDEILATFDPIGALAGMDRDLFKDLLQEVHSQETGVQEMLAELAEKNRLYDGSSEAEHEPQADKASELREKWQTEPGQLWLAGRHRLLCGDATNAVDVARLLAGAKPGLMVTDPPYGVEYNPEWRVKAKLCEGGALGRVENDDRADWREAWALFPGTVAYVWHAGLFAAVVQDSLEVSGFVMRSQIIWSKTHFPIGRGNYHWRHEPCWYAVRKGKAAHFIGDRSQTTVWEAGLDESAAGGHSTQKPVEIMARPLRNHKGDVYDPFLGTGTTLVAAEQHQRIGYGMEISPEYVAVALERLAGLGLEVTKE